MIDPKLNELPVSGTLSKKRGSSAETASDVAARPREGLSINDTIAGDANLSVGSRGVDTSGVRSGAGAGAGSSFVTPASTAAVAPSIVPGETRTGTTPAAGGGPIGRADTGLPGPGKAERDVTSRADKSFDEADYEQIRGLAYECWCERGCPQGSPEEDWHRAEREFRSRAMNSGKTSAAGA